MRHLIALLMLLATASAGASEVSRLGRDVAQPAQAQGSAPRIVSEPAGNGRQTVTISQSVPGREAYDATRRHKQQRRIENIRKNRIEREYKRRQIPRERYRHQRERSGVLEHKRHEQNRIQQRNQIRRRRGLGNSGGSRGTSVIERSADRITRSAVNTTTHEIQRSISNAIRDGFNR